MSTRAFWLGDLHGAPHVVTMSESRFSNVDHCACWIPHECMHVHDVSVPMVPDLSGRMPTPSYHAIGPGYNTSLTNIGWRGMFVREVCFGNSSCISPEETSQRCDGMCRRSTRPLAGHHASIVESSTTCTCTCTCTCCCMCMSCGVSRVSCVRLSDFGVSCNPLSSSGGWAKPGAQGRRREHG